MSLAAVSICCSCSRITQDVSIACTECNNLCCRTCFGLMKEEADSSGDKDDVDPDQDELVRTKRAKVVRVCSRCRRGEDNETKEDPASETQEPAREPPEDENTSVEEEAVPAERLPELKQERCWLHEMEYTLYCLSCDELVCGSCFLLGRSHMRHQIDLVETVYLERRDKTEQKLDQLKEKAELLQQNSVQIEANLEILQEVERSVYDEIDLLCTKAKQSVAKITDSRKQTLQMQSEFPAEAQIFNDTVQETIRQLPQAEFLRQQAQIEKQCDEMLGESVPGSFVIKRFEDIGCELIPPFITRTIRFNHFESTTMWPQPMITVCEIRWTVCVFKKDSSLFVKVTPHTEEALKLPFKLLVVLVHRELPKTIRKTFTIQRTSEELEIASIDRLETEGFVEQSRLVVKLGLRPWNALAEKRMVKQQFGAMMKTIDNLVHHAKPFKRDMDSVLVSNQVYIIHYFDVTLFKEENEPPCQTSEYVTDHGGRMWCLRVYPLDRNDTKTNLNTYILLRTEARVKCRFFIELMHSDPAKNFQDIRKHLFDKSNAVNFSSCGWNPFIERQQLLRDPGFYPDGMMLRFRFGVLPMAD